jgi:capsular exopolysaccharide synthesis family protein
MPDFFTPRDDFGSREGSRIRPDRLLAGPLAPLTGGGEEFGSAPPPSGIDVRALIRRYGWLALALPLLGLTAGVVNGIRKAPLYRSRLVAEVQGISETFIRNSGDPYSSRYEASSVNLQTQIKLLESGVFTKKIADRIRQEIKPQPISRDDIFGKAHEKLIEGGSDPVARINEAIFLSSTTFTVRPINGTRLIELICDSTQPQVAAAYLNFIAEEFIEDGLRSYSRSSQKTTGWLSTQFVETKTNLKNAEDRLQAFLQTAGSFSGAETLDDTKLKHLQGNLAVIQSERISKQTRWEALSRANADTLPEVLKDPRLEQYHKQLNDLRQQRATLLTTLTENHYRVRRIDTQLRDLEAEYKQAYNQVSSSVLSQARSEYDAALRQEQLLQGAYRSQSRNVVGMVDKASEFNTLKREVDTLRQTHDSLLQRLNQMRATSSLTVEPIRVVDPALASDQPYTQKPYMNLAFGFMAGLAGLVVYAFVRERFDNSIRAPGTMPALFQVPELGVIPAIKSAGGGKTRKIGMSRSFYLALEANGPLFPPTGNDGKLMAAAWTEEDMSTAESFRAAMISLVRYAGKNKKHPVILITSAEPGEGKTTIVSNLGIALSEAANGVLLIDADFRRSSLHKVFGVAGNCGMSTVLNDPRPVAEIPLKEYVVPTGVPGLYLLPCGEVIDNISPTIQSRRFEEILSFLQGRFSVTLVDSPPTLMFADARLLGRLCDGAVVVVRAEKTTRDKATKALQSLIQSGVPIIGTILNSWQPTENQTGQYYNYYNGGGK